jgi:hypothetical protein
LKTTDPLGAIYAIRAMNVLIVAAALVLFAAALPRMVPAFAARVAVLALVCLHPLFFQNAARVANDALALATGLAGISLVMLADSRTLLSRGLLAAVCIAASIWSKQTGLTLIPALVLGLPLIGSVHGVPAGRLSRVTIAVIIVVLVLAAPLWLWSYAHYGSIVTTQESLELAARGSVMQAVARSFLNVDWLALIRRLFIPGAVWVGGWSSVPMNETLAAVHGWCWGIAVTAAVVGGLVAIRRAASVQTAACLVICALVVVASTLGMVYHALVSNALFGGATTNAWYFMTALPFLFVLLIRGLQAIDGRVAIATALMAALYVAIDLHGTWIDMPAYYANSTHPALVWRRLSTIHPSILSGDRRWLFLSMQLGVIGLVPGALVYAWRNRTAFEP